MPASPNEHDNTLPVSDAPTLPEATITETEGATIGRYKLLQVIGEGGFGVVYMAEQTEPVTRRVALKIIKLGMDTRQVIARFEAERQALALMDHPNIAKVLDAGATDTGRPYFVMELVKGVPITKYCDDHKLSTEDRLRLFLDVCHAIQHAHQKGIIHRDIKPSNILVTLHDGKPVPKVIDFGIAKATQAKLTDKTLFTRFEQIIGTPAYMSPEQAEMSGLDIDTRTDIYSLGVLLYELLTGTTPFDTKQLLSAGLDEMRRIIREQEPIRPSTRLSRQSQSVAADGRRLTSLPQPAQSTIRNPQSTINVDPDLDWISLKCLEKDRARRYETANALALDVQRHLASEPVSARPPTNYYRLQKLARRNKTSFFASVVTLLALLVAAVVSVTMLLREKKSRQTAERAQISERIEKEQAILAREHARSLSYTSDMDVAWRALGEGDYARVDSLLRGQVPAPGEADLRGWEWRYLAGVARGEQIFSLGAVGSSIFELIRLSDDRLLAGYRGLGGIKIWDPERREVAFEAALQISALALSPDGREIAVSRGSNRIEILELRSLKKVRELQSSSSATSLSYSPNGKLIAATGGQQVSVLDSDTGTLRWSAKTLLNWQNSPSFSPDGRWLAIQSRDQSLTILSSTNGNIVNKIDYTYATASRLTFSPDGTKLAFGGYPRHVHLLHMPGGKTRVLTNHSVAVLSVAFSPDGQLLASGSIDGNVKLWNTETGEELASFRGHRDAVLSLAFSADADRLFSGGADGTIRAWSARPTGGTAAAAARGTFLYCALSRDGLWAAAVDTNSVCRIIPPEGNASIATPVITHYTRFHALAFRPDGLEMAAGNVDGTVQFVGTLDGRLVRSYQAHSNEIDFVEYSSTAKYVATAARGGEVRVWEQGRAEPVVSRTLARPGDIISSMVFVPNSARLLVLKGKQIHPFELSRANPSDNPWLGPIHGACLDVSPDGRFLAVGHSGVGEVSIIDLASQRETIRLRASFGSLNSISFSPDGRRIAGADSEGANWLWDVATGRVVGRHAGADGFGRLTWTPDGNALVLQRADQQAVLTAPTLADINTRFRLNQ